MLPGQSQVAKLRSLSRFVSWASPSICFDPSLFSKYLLILITAPPLYLFKWKRSLSLCVFAQSRHHDTARDPISNQIAPKITYSSQSDSISCKTIKHYWFKLADLYQKLWMTKVPPSVSSVLISFSLVYKSS